MTWIIHAILYAASLKWLDGIDFDDGWDTP